MEKLTEAELNETIRLLKNCKSFRHLAEQAELEIIRRKITEEIPCEWHN